MHRYGYEKIAHLYDLFDTKDNISFFYEFARRTGEVLDIGAGTGRIALPLAEKGIKVYAVEPSPDMRGEFSKKLSQRPELAGRIVLVDAEAQNFNLGRTFTGAFMSGCFDHFLDDRERLSILGNIRRHLAPAGTLVFDLYPGLMRDSPLHPAGTARHGAYEYRRFIKSKVKEQEQMFLRFVYEIYENGRRVDVLEVMSSAGLITRARLHRLLKETGFEPVAEYGDFDCREYDSGDEILIIEVRRKI